jgi:hypothetical protein
MVLRVGVSPFPPAVTTLSGSQSVANLLGWARVCSAPRLQLLAPLYHFALHISVASAALLHPSSASSAVAKSYTRLPYLHFFQIYPVSFLMKNTVFLDVPPCGSCKDRRFGRKYRLHHQVEKISELQALAVTSS